LVIPGYPNGYTCDVL